MPRLFDDPIDFAIFASGAVVGLSLRVVNNGDGTATLTWSGYNLEAIDVDGTWSIDVSTDGTTWSELTTGIASDVLTDDVTLTVYQETYYYRVRALDNADNLLQTSNRVGPVVSDVFDPATLTGLIGQWEGALADPFYTDTGLTTPAASNGNTIRGFRDSSGNNNHLTQSGAVLTRVAGPNSLPAMSGGWMLKTGIRPTGASATYSFAAVIRADAIATTIFGNGTSFNDGVYFNTSDGAPSFFRGGSGYARFLAVSAGTSSEWRLLICIGGRGGTGKDVGAYIDGEGVGGLAAANPSTISNADFYLGSNAGVSGTFNKPIAAAWFSSACWTHDEVNGLVSYCQDTYGTGSFAPTSPLVLCSGNSITYGTGATVLATDSYPAQMATSLAGFGGYSVVNLGIAGQTTAQLLAMDPGRIWPFGNSSLPHIVIANETTNSPKVQADEIARLTSLYDGYRDAGFLPKRIIVMTVLPAGVFTGGYRAAINTAMRDLCTARGYTLCDWAADPTMGPDGANSNLTYYADGTHPTTAGYTILAGIADAAVRVAAS